MVHQSPLRHRSPKIGDAQIKQQNLCSGGILFVMNAAYSYCVRFVEQIRDRTHFFTFF